MELKDIQNEESGFFLGIEDAKMSEVFSSTKHIDVRFLSIKHNVQSTMCIESKK
jgi:hypothetical protein